MTAEDTVHHLVRDAMDNLVGNPTLAEIVDLVLEEIKSKLNSLRLASKGNGISNYRRHRAKKEEEKRKRLPRGLRAFVVGRALEIDQPSEMYIAIEGIFVDIVGPSIRREG
ncbi:hypothetical protein Syun_017709 [Stephania yunnanensis]|uniref:Uncharacterized protein n=1 Tax=Stephania yunnanensis TaxID=152371 RepID=A0AAP0J9S8_9MAGN